jgi:hypothetical protein
MATEPDARAVTTQQAMMLLACSIVRENTPRGELHMDNRGPVGTKHKAQAFCPLDVNQTKA